MTGILKDVKGPADLKQFNTETLEQLASEVRKMIIETVSRTGGHLAANLGVVELTLALLKVFDPEQDRIVWDVSHQCYAFKILTGRKDRFSTLRQYGGISGFLRREESPCDAFGAGHSGTALSAALGMAVARDRHNGGEHVIAVIGDGAAGCGISLEAFNNVADTTQRLIVILNDNEMSIASNVGSLSSSLGRMLANPRYNRWKKSVENFAGRMKMGWMRSAYYRLEEAIKSLFLRSVLFEEFGLRYIGPIDGHNINALINALSIARDSDRPILLHVSTQKGKGYAYAEELPDKWHGTSAFDVATGELTSIAARPAYSNVFGLTLERLAASDDSIIAITAGMPDGTGLWSFAQRYPDRFFDVGISEEHAVVFAAGAAARGLRPVFAVYSTFLQRAVDCVIHDVCLQDLPVLLCLDRAGIVGDDGPTHHGIFDIALLRPVPGLIMMQPKDEAELANMIYTSLQEGHPATIRYPRGCGPGLPVPDDYEKLEIGKAEIVTEGREVQIWALGDMLPAAMACATALKEKGINAGVVNSRFIKPLDGGLLAGHAAAARLIATVENGVVSGGFGSGVEEFLMAQGYAGRVVKFGWPDEFPPQGPNQVLFRQYGLDSNSITERILKLLK